MNRILLYAEQISPRLRYISSIIGVELEGHALQLTDRLETFQSWTGPRILYADAEVSGSQLWIKPAGLVFEQGISVQPVTCEVWQGLKVFYKTTGELPFDIFSSSFYLLSRYEEYQPHEKDEYGRYAHWNSLAFKEGFLKEPLINQWIRKLGEIIQEKFPDWSPATRKTEILPSYDIDIAWSYRGKGFLRNAAAISRSLAKKKISSLRERINTLSGRAADPFDSYDFLNQLHQTKKLSPLYFFLVAAKRGVYDKNIPPTNKDLQSLIGRHAMMYEIGLHPSWRSGDETDLLQAEKAMLERISGKQISRSRQHYIRFTLPTEYRRLIQAGITDDYSMGYGTINGFRASFCNPYPWYDLEAEKPTDLIVHPFCFMDANAYYEEKLTPQQALEEMQDFYKNVDEVKGRMMMIWHNQFLGTDPEFSGWKEVYQRFFIEDYLKENVGNMKMWK